MSFDRKGNPADQTEPYPISLPWNVARDIAHAYEKRQAKFRRVADREILIAGKDRQALEAIFETTIADAPDLIAKVKKLCAFSIGGVERTFTADELARIDSQAGFHGRTREQFIQNMIEEIVGYMMDRV